MSLQPLGARPRIVFADEGADVDAVVRQTSAIFGAGSRFVGLREGRVMKAESTTFGAVTIARAHLMNWRLERGLEPTLVVLLPVEGEIVCSNRRLQQDVRAGHGAAILPPYERVDIEVVRARCLTLTIPVETFALRAERLTGRAPAPNAGVALPDRLSLETPAAAALARHMRAAIAEAVELEPYGLSPAVFAGYEDLLLSLAVACLFAPCEAPARPTAPVAVRRAREHIRAHAEEPIDFADLAAALGLSMRAMQENFRRYYGQSPRDYLLAVRLANARRRLTLDDQAASVTVAAFDCGFRDLGYFAAKYREKYGELPSETLREAQGRQL